MLKVGKIYQPTEGVSRMTDHEPRGIARIDWILLAALLALVLPLRLWLLHNTEVCSRDGIGYIRYALKFEKQSITTTLKETHQHPGYSALVWLASVPIRADQGLTPDAMVLSAQLVSLVASLVLLFPMYFLGRQFFHRGISFGAALLYQYLPISAHHLSDALSEPVYLVFLVSAILQMVHTMRERSIARGMLCGLFAGLAYLVRPEGALVLPAVAIALCIGQLVPAWRVSWRQFVGSGVATACTAMLVGSFYVYIIGGLSNKPTVRIIHQDVTLHTESVGFLFAATYQLSDHRMVRLQRCGVAVVMELAQGLHYVGVIPALLGGLMFFRRLRTSLGFWAVVLYAAVHIAILVMMAMSVAYVSDRHVMILVIFATYFVVAGIDELPRRIFTPAAEGTQTSWRRSPAIWSVLVAGLILGACLPKATQRLHGNRVGNHEAGLWLAEHVVAGDHIEDDHNWSHFYAGHLFLEGREPSVPRSFQPTTYIVLTRSRDVNLTREREGKLLTSDARVVYHWPANSDVAQARIVVYAQKRNFETNPWKKHPD